MEEDDPLPTGSEGSGPQNVGMAVERGTWREDLAVTALSAALLVVLLLLVRRYQFGDGWQWAESTGIAVPVAAFQLTGSAWARRRERRRAAAPER